MVTDSPGIPERHWKILIVDDEPLNVDYLEQELEDLDCETVSAGNGREALELIAAEKPDLILLDIMMPIMDGYAVLGALKADRATRDIPVIVISAMNDLSSIVRGIELGAEDYLPKPFDPVLLQARIGSSLEKKRLHDQERLYLQGLERELEIGRQIQGSFLPERLPQIPGWDIAAHFQAAREVAGDFYDVFELPRERRIALVLGDVADKGVGAALYMTLFRSLIRALANWDAYTGWRAADTAAWGPSATLSSTILHINNYIERVHGQTGMFATLFFGLLDGDTGTLHYLNAGHEPALILNRGRIVSELSATGPAVGVLPDVEFTVAEARLETGDTLLLVTDGTTDARDSYGRMFGWERLLGLAGKRVDTTAELLGGIASELQRYMGEAGQFDDITMMAVRRL